jgi:hypothetical protein
MNVSCLTVTSATPELAMSSYSTLDIVSQSSYSSNPLLIPDVGILIFISIDTLSRRMFASTSKSNLEDVPALRKQCPPKYDAIGRRKTYKIALAEHCAVKWMALYLQKNNVVNSHDLGVLPPKEFLYEDLDEVCKLALSKMNGFMHFQMYSRTHDVTIMHMASKHNSRAVFKSYYGSMPHVSELVRRGHPLENYTISSACVKSFCESPELLYRTAEMIGWSQFLPSTVISILKECSTNDKADANTVRTVLFSIPRDHYWSVLSDISYIAHNTSQSVLQDIVDVITANNSSLTLHRAAAHVPTLYKLYMCGYRDSTEISMPSLYACDDPEMTRTMLALRYQEMPYDTVTQAIRYEQLLKCLISDVPDSHDDIRTHVRFGTIEDALAVTYCGLSFNDRDLRKHVNILAAAILLGRPIPSDMSIRYIVMGIMRCVQFSNKDILPYGVARTICGRIQTILEQYPKIVLGPLALSPLFYSAHMSNSGDFIRFIASRCSKTRFKNIVIAAQSHYPRVLLGCSWGSNYNPKWFYDQC